MLVQLKDADSGEIFKIEMTLQEWERCDGDLLYAQELMEKARKATENNGTVGSAQVHPDVGGYERHTWSYEEIIKLIAAIESHYEELLAINPKTKKDGKHS